MEVPPRAARQRGVGDVPDQHVLERELDVALDLALRAPEDQAPFLEPVERLVDRRQLADPLQHAAPEGRTDHGGVEQGRARRRRQRVDPRGDRRSHGRRQLLARDLVRHRGDQLLQEEGVPFGDRHHALDGGGRRLREEGGRHRLRVGIAERLERKGRLADQPAAPGASGLEELGPREREDHHPRVPDVRHEVIDQVEQGVVGPVHVLEHEQQRLAPSEMLHEHPHREQEVDRLVRRSVEAEPEE